MRKFVYRNYVFESVEGEIPEVLYHGSSQNFSRFELGHSEQGQNLQKFGRGIYLTDTLELAEYYAEGSERYIYECSIPRSSMNLISWDDNVDEGVYRRAANILAQMGHEEDAEKLIEELDSYGETISADSLYNILKDVVGDESVSEIFQKCRVDGFIAKDISNRGRIFVILDPSRIKINNVEKIG